MPSPIAHSITGFALYHFFYPHKKIIPESKNDAVEAFFYMFLAIFADFDFIPQLLTGEKYHHGFTHSLLFTVCIGLMFGTISNVLAKKRDMKVFFLAVAVYGSHLLLDYFTKGGDGIQLLWPLSKEYYISPLAIFPGVHHSRGLFDISHLVFLGFEFCYAALLMTALWFWKSSSDKMQQCLR
jgi:inner membrane protein